MSVRLFVPTILVRQSAMRKPLLCVVSDFSIIGFNFLDQITYLLYAWRKLPPLFEWGSVLKALTGEELLWSRLPWFRKLFLIAIRRIMDRNLSRVSIWLRYICPGDLCLGCHQSLFYSQRRSTVHIYQYPWSLVYALVGSRSLLEVYSLGDEIWDWLTFSSSHIDCVFITYGVLTIRGFVVKRSMIGTVRGPSGYFTLMFAVYPVTQTN